MSKSLSQLHFVWYPFLLAFHLFRTPMGVEPSVEHGLGVDRLRVVLKLVAYG